MGRNGEHFVGRVVEEKADAVVFDSELGGRLTVPRARIQELQRTAPAELAEPSGTTSPAPIPAASSPNPLSSLDPQPSTNSWQPPGIGRDGSDWIQLKSGEWLRGHLKYIQERKVTFDSDELKDLSLDLKNVRQVHPAKPLFTKFDGRDQIYGTLVISNDVVRVFGPEQVTLPRAQLTGVTPGGKREIDFWSGKANLGLSLQSGNTKQSPRVRVRSWRAERRPPWASSTTSVISAR